MAVLPGNCTQSVAGYMEDILIKVSYITYILQRFILLTGMFVIEFRIYPFKLTKESNVILRHYHMYYDGVFCCHNLFRCKIYNTKQLFSFAI